MSSPTDTFHGDFETRRFEPMLLHRLLAIWQACYCTLYGRAQVHSTPLLGRFRRYTSSDSLLQLRFRICCQAMTRLLA
jgi:hypothetical protein